MPLKEDELLASYKEWLEKNSDILADDATSRAVYDSASKVVLAYKQELEDGRLDPSALDICDLRSFALAGSYLKSEKETIIDRIRDTHLSNDSKESLINLFSKHFEDTGALKLGFFESSNRRISESNFPNPEELILFLIFAKDEASSGMSVEEICSSLSESSALGSVSGEKAIISEMLHVIAPEVFPISNKAARKYWNVLIEGFESLSYPEQLKAITELRDSLPWWAAHPNYRLIDVFGWNLPPDSANEGSFAIDASLNFDKKKLSRIIERYKSRFYEIRGDIDSGDGEGFRWRAIKHFRDSWNPDAPDFAAMVERSMMNDDVDFLIRGYAKGYGDVLATLKVLVEYEPETFRKLFNALAHDSKSFLDRIKDFRSGCKEVFGRLCKEDPSFEKKQHLQSTKAVSVYAFLLDPDETFIYRGEDCNKFESMIGFSSKSKQGQKAQAEFFELAEQICEILQGDDQLCALSDSSSSSFFADEKRHVLTDEIIYFATHYMEDGDMEENDMRLSDGNYSKNIILYGPPGTGKTYNVAMLAKAISDGEDPLAIDFSTISEQERESAKEWYDRELKDPSGHVAFTTFHQSYSYEDFIEGIRPVIVEDGDGVSEGAGGLRYCREDGVFKSFCDRAGRRIPTESSNKFSLNPNPTVWKVSLNGTGDNPIRTDCIAKGHIRIGWDKYGASISDEVDFSGDGKNILNAFYNKMDVGDIVLSCYSERIVDAIGVITGEPEWHDEYKELKRQRDVQWIMTGIELDVTVVFGHKKMTLGTIYDMHMSASDVLQYIEEHDDSDSQLTVENKDSYIFVIDEINRGNISKIFGELITLIEDSKRKGADDEQWAVLPYSKRPFSIPQNVTILGTMNTADRSIALMDTALRRRFDFIEMPPRPELLENVVVAGVSVEDMLSAINERIEVLVDREHTIGHASFMKLAKLENPGIEDLARIFKRKIMPLLQEYFYDDYSKIGMVLGEAFVDEDEVDVSLLDKYGEQIEKLIRFRIREEAFMDPAAYLAIYQREEA